MNRTKTKPTVHKPSFDEDSVLRFVAGGIGSDSQVGKPSTPGSRKETDAGRLPLTLMLKPEVIARLEEEAARKEKSAAQIVEKLVSKHLGKH